MGATTADVDPFAGGPSETVGVRELRQRASELLARAQAGATVTVTRSGRPVARLVPISPPDDPVAALIADGRAVRATDPADLLDVVPAPAATGESPSAALARLRDEERW